MLSRAANVFQAVSVPLPRSRSVTWLLGVFIGISISLSSSALAQYLRRRREERENQYLSHLDHRPIEIRSDEIIREGVSGLVGWSCKDIIVLNILTDYGR